MEYKKEDNNLLDDLYDINIIKKWGMNNSLLIILKHDALLRVWCHCLYCVHKKNIRE